MISVFKKPYLNLGYGEKLDNFAQPFFFFLCSFRHVSSPMNDCCMNVKGAHH